MKYVLRSAVATAALVMTLGMTTSVQAAKAAKTKVVRISKTQASQVLGLDLARSLPPIVRKAIRPSVVARTLRAELEGRKSPLSKAKFQALKQAFMEQLRAQSKIEFDKLAAKNKAKGKAFLAKNSKVKGVKVTASGLQYMVLAGGKGKTPGANDSVQVQYTGKLLSGKVFDSSKMLPKGIATIPLGSVIPGFREGLKMMKPGAHYKLFIPASLAYGASQRGMMAPNETLIFDVTLVKVIPQKSNAGKK